MFPAQDHFEKIQLLIIYRFYFLKPQIRIISELLSFYTIPLNSFKFLISKMHESKQLICWQATGHPTTFKSSSYSILTFAGKLKNPITSSHSENKFLKFPIFLRGKERASTHTLTHALSHTGTQEPSGGQRITQELVLSCHLVESRGCTQVIRPGHKGFYAVQALR